MFSPRTKTLISDLIAFLVGGTSIKLLSFFMVPLYTFFLSTEDYAVSDLVSLSVQLAIPLLTLSISDAVLRFGLERGSDLDSVLGTGLAVTLIGSVAAFPICFIVGALTNDWWVASSAYLLFLLQGLSSYYAAYFKCVNRVKLMALISSVAGISIVILNVLFIAVLRLGLHGYWLGNVFGNCIGLGLYLAFGGWRALALLRKPEQGALRQMLRYSVPLIPNSLFWWINSSMDRFVLTALSTLSFVGLYSAASKIPQILSTVSSFFFQAWNISVFQDFGTEESASFFKKGFLFISFGSFSVAGGLIVINAPLARLLFSGDFFEAWKLVPLLLTGTYVSILNQFLGSFFTASKDTKIIFTTTAVGSIVNIILNILLVIGFGGIGAVVGTLVSYLVVYAARAIKISGNYSFLRLSHFAPGCEIAGLCILSMFSMSGADLFPLGALFLLMIFLSCIYLYLSRKTFLH